MRAAWLLLGAAVAMSGCEKPSVKSTTDVTASSSALGTSATPTVTASAVATRTADDGKISYKALAKFFDKLTRVENKESKAVARILYFGDSVVAGDFVTGPLRRLLQKRFGDAGHGYALAANAWKGYFHIDVSRKSTAGWRPSTCVGPYSKGGRYGLGCASFTSGDRKEWFEFGTAERGPVGGKAARFELEFLRQPGGGSAFLYPDGSNAEYGGVITDDSSEQVEWYSVDLPDGAHRVKVQPHGDGPVTVFGMRMERDGPGLTLSALGVTGARVRFLDKQDDEHWRRVLEHAEPDLVVLAFGAMDIVDGSMLVVDAYEKGLEAVMAQIEKAVPGASFMLVGPTDVAKDGGGSLPTVLTVVNAQARAAKKRGWAFFDQLDAMGGAGTMWSWSRSGLASSDLVHPTANGGLKLGQWQYEALMQAYEKHKAAR